ncbi:hypothetical protein [Sorangium sp. So ce117]|uniref:hypothetical protein n=1 Tax=Sorangium sp. So ce117 TaxID=3133277 RepID=UPI003F62070D
MTAAAAEIRCDVCGAELASAEAHRRAFVRWWERCRDDGLGTSRVVVAFDVVCAGRCARHEEAARRAELSAPGFVVLELDGMLGWFAGRHAIHGLARLMRDYTWSDRAALERCLDFFVRAASLPDGEGPPSLG